VNPTIATDTGTREGSQNSPLGFRSRLILYLGLTFNSYTMSSFGTIFAIIVSLWSLQPPNKCKIKQSVGFDAWNKDMNKW
jgi:hypothetical protein